MGGSLPHHVRNGGGLEMKYQHNKRFLVDIFAEVQRMDVINRNCTNLLACIKHDMTYDDYLLVLKHLSALDDALRSAFNDLLELKVKLCDTQQQ